MRPDTWYNERYAETQKEVSITNKRIRNVSMLRITLFLTGIAIITYLWGESSTEIITWSLVAFIPFLGLLKVHTKLFNRKQWLEIKADLIRKELLGLKNDYSEFDEGNEFINPNHKYTFDLDVFGKKSLFQAINRTCTQIGKRTLGHWLENHLRDKSSIEERQACIKELCKNYKFREEFAIIGNINQSVSEDEINIRKWVEESNTFTQATWVKVLVWGVPTTNIILLLLGFLDILSYSWFGMVFFSFIVISFSVVKRAAILQEEYTEKLMTLNTYTQLIALMEKQAWEAPHLKNLIKTLKINEQSPAKALTILSKELSRLDLRNNQFLYVILEGSMFFQLRQMVRIENWKIKYGNYLEDWLRVVGEIDALCSLATFSYNHPYYIYPTISEKPFCLEARDMGHPLMPVEQCVKNDANIPHQPYFLIITGANMAGKSTYLRTIGTNYLLACIGAPVCCKELKLYPSQLVTSLRTSDSLSEHESYFFAELKRLKHIIDLLNSGEELFIILDEILKGTNSTDKQKGSFNLVKQFILTQANGIIATHDLLLGELANVFPNEIKNYCFEADITNDQLTFSYKIREGVAQNMNACFLMKQMGIVFD